MSQSQSGTVLDESLPVVPATYRFSDLEHDLDEQTDGHIAKAISFVCLLHVANERSYELVQEESLLKSNDFRIVLPEN